MKKNRTFDWTIILLPMIIILILCTLFLMHPEGTKVALTEIRSFFGDSLGVTYLLLGLGFFAISLYIAFSKYGDIVLGDPNEKPLYSFGTWGSMMFTCGLAADIIFYSFSEWIIYANDDYVKSLGNIQEWAGVFPLFHWSFIPWSFYLVLAVSFGFMLHVRKKTKQKFSEACRPILGKQTDGITGKTVDLFAVFALLAGTATTFSIATPLMSSIVNKLFGISLERKQITIIILLLTCFFYTVALLKGLKGIKILAKICIFLFWGLLAFVLLFGGEFRYIVETGIESLGKMIQNFVSLSTYIDPNRTNLFPQNWTIYYWAYWMVWCVAAPFFIGNISRGRTIKQTIVGGYVFGTGSTVLSFIVLGNYSLGLQTSGKVDFISQYANDGDLYEIIINIIDSLPFSEFVMAIILISMIAFYATSFDSIAYTAACYSYHRLGEGEEPNKFIKIFWGILLILLPIALTFSESSMNNIQSISIISAFPIALIMLVIVISFFADAKKCFKESD